MKSSVECSSQSLVLGARPKETFVRRERSGKCGGRAWIFLCQGSSCLLLVWLGLSAVYWGVEVLKPSYLLVLGVKFPLGLSIQGL